MSEEVKTERDVTPEEVERMMLEREQNSESNPLDVHAAMFKFYIPRLKGQTQYMSKKQLQAFMYDLSGCEYNDKKDLNKIYTMTKDLNIKALYRVMMAVIENPLQEVEFNLLNDKEKRLFMLFDALLTNKYYNSIKTGLENKQKDENASQELEDFVIHNIDLQSKKFRSREKYEIDAFMTGNKLLASKFLMIMISQMEYLQSNPEIVNKMKEEGKEDGTQES